MRQPVAQKAYDNVALKAICKYRTSRWRPNVNIGTNFARSQRAVSITELSFRVTNSFTNSNFSTLNPARIRARSRLLPVKNLR